MFVKFDSTLDYYKKHKLSDKKTERKKQKEK